MNKQKIILPLFIGLALVQLYIPASMILAHEEILSEGEEVKFRTRPIDPYDPFRGKYITLSFDSASVRVDDENEWEGGESIFVLLDVDGRGMAKPKSVQKVKPAGNRLFVEATVLYRSYNGANVIFIEYPFNRYYMEESKAYPAELAHREASADTSKLTYAVVRIKDGQAVLKDVMIDGVSIRDVVTTKDQ